MIRNVLCTVFLSALLSAGCVTTGTTPLPAAAQAAEGAIGPSDVLDIKVLEDVEISGNYQVDAAANIAFPYIGVVQVGGLTPQQIAVAVAEQLTEGGYFNAPVVTVLVVEFNSRVVYVLGSVRTPGSYTYTDGMGVIDAISAAGGLLETGQPNGTTVTRKVDGVEYSVQLPVSAIVNGRRPDQRLAVGDIIFVPESPI
jgi:protein involved in polysaccharide export with SLBB domain